MSAIDDTIVRTPKDLGAVLRARRRTLGLDQKTLAARVGVSRQWIIDVEKGKVRAAVGLLLRTLDVLGLELAVRVRGARGDDAVDAPDIDAVLARLRRPPPRPGKKRPR